MPTENVVSKLRPGALFQFFALAEVVTWGLLLSGLALKALAVVPSVVVTVVGSIHGFVFLGYALIAALVGVNQRWGFIKVTSAVALAILPFATLPFERHLIKRGYLEGEWRIETSEDPRDKFWLDRLFRWFIARPIFLASVLFLSVIAIFALLLFLGPPGGS